MNVNHVLFIILLPHIPINWDQAAHTITSCIRHPTDVLVQVTCLGPLHFKVQINIIWCLTQNRVSRIYTWNFMPYTAAFPIYKIHNRLTNLSFYNHWLFITIHSILTLHNTNLLLKLKYLRESEQMPMTVFTSTLLVQLSISSSLHTGNIYQFPSLSTTTLANCPVH